MDRQACFNEFKTIVAATGKIREHNFVVLQAVSSIQLGLKHNQNLNIKLSHHTIKYPIPIPPHIVN
jgi:hypothetical protein